MGDELGFFVEEGKIINHTRKEVLSFSPLPPVLKKILNDAGLVEHIRKYGDLNLV